MFERTPRELLRDVQAARSRSQEQWRRTAYLASWLMQAWCGKEAPSPAMLLGEQQPPSPEEAEEQMLRLMDPTAANLAALSRFGATQAERIARGAD